MVGDTIPETIAEPRRIPETIAEPRYPESILPDTPFTRRLWKAGIDLPGDAPYVAWPEQLRRGQEVLDILDATIPPPPSKGLIATGLDLFNPKAAAREAAIARASAQLAELLFSFGCNINASPYDRGGGAPPPLRFRLPGTIADHVIATIGLILQPVDLVIEDSTEARKDARREIFSRVTHLTRGGSRGPVSNAMFRLGHLFGL